jgi:hypothetical protein
MLKSYALRRCAGIQNILHKLDSAPQLQLESLTLSGTGADVNMRRLLSNSRLRALTVTHGPTCLQHVLENLMVLTTLTRLTLTNTSAPYRAALQLTSLQQLHCLTLSNIERIPASQVQTAQAESRSTSDSAATFQQLVALNVSGSHWDSSDLSVCAYFFTQQYSFNLVLHPQVEYSAVLY